MDSSPFVRAFAHHWWVLLLRGILAVLFGIVAFAWPGLTLVTLVLLYGAYALVDGLTALWVGGSAREWSFVFVGVLGIIAGILTFIYPGITTIVLLYMIASWAIVRGVFEIVTAIRLRKEISNEWLLILGGVVSILFGVVLVLNPAAGALAMVWLIGAYALVFGVMMIVLAFRLRGLRQRWAPGPA
ncbi:MAG TPA: HdeD family acid-resistance protein [Pyrinomonadaceae bacterium]